jgi:hypothetical protein
VGGLQNSVSLLSAESSNQNGRIIKLETRAIKVPVVKDATGAIIGPLVGTPQRGQNPIFNIYFAGSNSIVGLNPNTGHLSPLEQSRAIYFTGSNCTGQAMVHPNDLNATYTGGSTGRYFSLANFSAFTNSITVNSYLGGNCINMSPNTFSPIDGMYLVQEINVPFSLPLQAPLSIAPSW